MADRVAITREDLAHPLALSLPAHVGEGPHDPEVCYCIATAPRNGSTMLSAALWSTGALGRPEEYLRPEDVRLWAARWGLEWPNPDGWPAYFRALTRAATTPNGVCALKLFPRHVMAVPEEIFEDPVTTFGTERIKFVHLRRRDLVRAGLSEWKAQTSGQWVRLPGEAKVDPPRPPSTGEISRYHGFQHAWDWFWLAARAEGVEWVELHYEDVVRSLPAAVDRVAELVDVRLDTPVEAAPRTLRQSDPRDEAWIERWVKETGGCEECGYA